MPTSKVKERLFVAQPTPNDVASKKNSMLSMMWSAAALSLEDFVCVRRCRLARIQIHIKLPCKCRP
jgi:hypothetical protein